MEPERYELFAEPAYQFALSRRDFLRALGGGIILLLCSGVTLDDADAQGRGESGGGGRPRRGSLMPLEIEAWLHINEDGAVTVYSGKVEVGQNIRTSLTQAVAEELRVPMTSVSMVLGDTELTPYDAGTFGSRTTPTMSTHLRKVASAARELLIDLAAEQVKAPRDTFAVADGKVTHVPTKQAFNYGQLTKGRKLVKAIGPDVTTTAPKEWKVSGQSALKVNGRAMVTGRHRYTSDMTRPAMLHGKILRPYAFNATLISVDTRQAAAMPGVQIVRDGDFVGVTAPDPYRATQAMEIIEAKWKTTDQPSTAQLFDYLTGETDPPAAKDPRTATPEVRGNVDAGLAAAQRQLKSRYTVAYIAHAPLEPRAAVAEWNDGKLTVWTGTQRPFGVRAELANAFNIPESSVRVIVPDTGSGYGGKHTGEAAIEAARLAKAAGKPVKLVWTREEEFTWAYFRPAGVIDITSSVRDDGTITAWACHNYNSGSAGIRTSYEIPNQQIQFHETRSLLRQGSYRALAATANNFARESHMDELAHAVKMDPLQFRLKNLKDERLRAVFQAAAERFGWGKTKKLAGHGFGMGGGFEKGGYVATCAEVAVEGTEVRLGRVVTAFECGAVVNPEHLKDQVEGAVIQGIGGALFEAIEFEGGKILNGRFSAYRVPRFGDTPVLETVLLDRKDLPSAGAGECPIVGIAPAIGNAIFDASGIRLRSLPLVPTGLKNPNALR
ncbi:MAG TPA: molybdopterin cofactor-binding domain-containing protein [Abditibacteriaceae bacterium]|nr:molybdopterin cofactor-binding domain-containing protein [Abditibacteriaceae bacterium]